MTNLFLFLPFLFFSVSAFAEDVELKGKGQNSLWQTLIMIGIACLCFYLILWRPEQRRRKKIEAKRNELSKGDRVTAMGIIGTVARVEDKTVVLKMIDGAKIEVVKGAITDVQSASLTEKARDLPSAEPKRAE